MDIYQAMRVFVRVVETGSFTAAAQALGYSTAQTSRLLSELESSLQARHARREEWISARAHLEHDIKA